MEAMCMELSRNIKRKMRRDRIRNEIFWEGVLKKHVNRIQREAIAMVWPCNKIIWIKVT
jgi:hypothetical protein